MKRFYKALAAVMFFTAIVFAAGCKPEEVPNNGGGNGGNNNGGGNNEGGNDTVAVVVATLEPNDITSTTALCHAEITESGGLTFDELGVCWSTHENPTINDDHLFTDTPGVGAFTCTITNLEPNTEYHVRAYALLDTVCYYGGDKSFTTLDPGNNDGHDYVDLGLPSGTLWATCNVGANSPEERGDRFAWGETQPKDYYSWDNYRYGRFNQLTKYCNRTNCGLSGYTDALTILQAEDDAATANWGNGWRTPTAVEFAELCQHTTPTWTTMNGINGMLFTSSNGNSLFLPSTGDLDGEGIGDGGCYWTSTLDTERPVGAWSIGFRPQGLVGVFPVNGGDGGRKGRYCGVAIRPIRYLNEPSNEGGGAYFNLDVNVATSEPSNITATTAECTAEITEIILIPQGYYNGNLGCELGLCWSTHENPTINDEHSFAVSYEGIFTCTLNGLEPNTEYHVRAYASLGQYFHYYGEDKSFTTLDPGNNDGHDYVDLGLPSGTLWATCNVGADTPEGYGDYFAWGETTTKGIYNWSTYTYCNGTARTLKKYCVNADYGYNGFTDDLVMLQPNDDAAAVNWGSGWYMPTEDQWRELLQNTLSVWTNQNGVNGRLFTADNGNSIFVPASGYRMDDQLSRVDTYGAYWTKSLFSDESCSAWGFKFADGGDWNCFFSESGRYFGFPIRPVRSAN